MEPETLMEAVRYFGESKQLMITKIACSKRTPRHEGRYQWPAAVAIDGRKFPQ